jgi:hypothetical protein
MKLKGLGFDDEISEEEEAALRQMSPPHFI